MSATNCSMTNSVCTTELDHLVEQKCENTYDLSDDERQEREFQRDIARAMENKRQREFEARAKIERARESFASQIAYYTPLHLEARNKLIQIDALVTTIEGQLAKIKEEMRTGSCNFDELFQRVIDLTTQRCDQERCRLSTQGVIVGTGKELSRLEDHLAELEKSII